LYLTSHSHVLFSFVSSNQILIKAMSFWILLGINTHDSACFLKLPHCLLKLCISEWGIGSFSRRSKIGGLVDHGLIACWFCLIHLLTCYLLSLFLFRSLSLDCHAFLLQYLIGPYACYAYWLLCKHCQRWDKAPVRTKEWRSLLCHIWPAKVALSFNLASSKVPRVDSSQMISTALDQMVSATIQISS
jgi:hypothetical protein